MVPRLRRHEDDLLRRHVRGVDHQHVHPAAQRGRERRVQVALPHPAAVRGHVAPRVLQRRRVDVRRVQLHAARQLRGHRRAQGADPAAQVQYHRAGPGQCHRLPHQELGAPARYEGPRADLHAQPAELRPADDVFQRFAAHPAGQQLRQVVRVGGGPGQELRLLLREDAARRAQGFHK